jgi:hypothetical protein
MNLVHRIDMLPVITTKLGTHISWLTAMHTHFTWPAVMRARNQFTIPSGSLFLPFTNVFISITPDILHQLLQGVLKNLIIWLILAFGPTEIDARCRRLPPNHHIHLFAKGISGLSRITGKEHKNMSRLLLGLILDLPLPGGQVSPRLVTAVCALLDFLFLAQFPSHTSSTLARLEESLARFHDNKDIFIDLGIRHHFNMPKIHSMIHYTPSI